MLAGLTEHLETANNLVLWAPPGVGKTTRVPPAIAACPFVTGRKVLVLEPRRLAARLAAGYLVEQGLPVGYQVRFDNRTGPDTRIDFLTSGILNRVLLSNPTLDGVAAVVLDEFHERHLEGDLALALLRRLQLERRPDLRLVVMSATLETGAVAAHLGDCPVLSSEVPGYPVEVRYTGHDPRPLEERVAGAVNELAALPGHRLVFLPGMAEILRCQQALAGHDTRILHGSLDSREQDQALRRSPTTKVILSTNVAESSVTVDGVTAVIDSGLVRRAEFSAWSGVARLLIARASQASCVQRTGRAGRTQPGVCIRLFALDDFLGRPEFDPPEVVRTDLARLALDLAALDIVPMDLPWLTPPPPDQLEAALQLLTDLGALEAGRITEAGREMASLSVSPRQARAFLACRQAGFAGAGCRLAAALEQPGPDPLKAEPDPHLVRQLLNQAGARFERAPSQVLRRAIFEAFVDRLGRVRKKTELAMARGRSLELSEERLDDTLWVVLEADERQARRPRVKAMSEVEPEWVWEDLLDSFEERVVYGWDDKAGRVTRLEQVVYGQLVLEETKRWAEPGPETAAELARHLPEPPPELATLLRRLELVRQHFPDLELPSPEVEALLTRACLGSTRLDEVAGSRLVDLARGALTYQQQQSLDKLAPTHLALPSRRRGAPISYPADRPPFVSSKLQDFFGLTQTPTILGGRLPLVVHLLAPNGRPVQVTSDLGGFWSGSYQRIRKELRGRYPRHDWPEDPPGSR
ncbi:MAG: ATP-dependent helicase HrpB [Vulcanimicrobiota bacterium]